MIEDPGVLTKALEALLVEKGLITSERIDELVKSYEEDIGPLRGAQVVARAWSDADYRKRLLEDGRSAVAEFGYIDPHGAELVAVENTEQVHNMVVCTLCSCYPRALLGLPPTWYKSADYRKRVVYEPRAVLAEFDTHLANHVEVRVHDSTADMRYLVLPRRPHGSDGLNQKALAALVTRDSMIGVTEALSPQP